ncbi:hypothetical protein RRG08_055345 [Elysia crispata]|uniref:Uncharacterized protein n=1 Tax=Elysia crispata TaxID=231223 RepID=A0AAE1AQN4_9GAST|nr:hypothetical protein RRG08_055345 [Elysia crispata]
MAGYLVIRNRQTFLNRDVSTERKQARVALSPGEVCLSKQVRPKVWRNPHRSNRCVHSKPCKLVHSLTASLGSTDQLLAGDNCIDVWPRLGLALSSCERQIVGLVAASVPVPGMVAPHPNMFSLRRHEACQWAQSVQLWIETLKCGQASGRIGSRSQVEQLLALSMGGVTRNLTAAALLHQQGDSKRPDLTQRSEKASTDSMKPLGTTWAVISAWTGWFQWFQWFRPHVQASTRTDSGSLPSLPPHERRVFFKELRVVFVRSGLQQPDGTRPQIKLVNLCWALVGLVISPCRTIPEGDPSGIQTTKTKLVSILSRTVGREETGRERAGRERRVTVGLARPATAKESKNMPVFLLLVLLILLEVHHPHTSPRYGPAASGVRDWPSSDNNYRTAGVTGTQCDLDLAFKNHEIL